MSRTSIDYDSGCFAFPKNARKKDKKVINNKQHDCEFCKRKNIATHTHHIKSKGSGGDDTEENTIELCWKCHRLTHDGLISKEDLLEIVQKRKK